MIAFHTAEYVRAVSSVTVSPESDCEPRRFHKDESQAFSLVRERAKNLAVLEKNFLKPLKNLRWPPHISSNKSANMGELYHNRGVTL